MLSKVGMIVSRRFVYHFVFPDSMVKDIISTNKYIPTFDISLSIKSKVNYLSSSKENYYISF